jgi:hypothetical protein
MDASISSFQSEGSEVFGNLEKQNELVNLESIMQEYKELMKVLQDPKEENLTVSSQNSKPIIDGTTNKKLDSHIVENIHTEIDSPSWGGSPIRNKPSIFQRQHAQPPSPIPTLPAESPVNSPLRENDYVPNLPQPQSSQTGYQFQYPISSERNTLLEALHLSEQKAAAAIQDKAIIEAEKEAALVDAKLVVQRLHGQMRSLVAGRGLEEVYSVMDEDCQRLRRELEGSYETIAVLETKVAMLEYQNIERSFMSNANANVTDVFGEVSNIEITNTPSKTKDNLTNNISIRASSPTAPTLTRSFIVGKSSPSSKTLLTPPKNNNSYSIDGSQIFSPNGNIDAAKKEIRRLTTKIKSYVRDMELLRKENEQLRSQHRTHAIALRQSKDAGRRVYLSTKTTNKAQEMHENEVIKHAATQKELIHLRSELSSLHEESHALREEVFTLQGQINSAQMQVKEYEQIVKQEHKLNRFVRKHVPREASFQNMSALGVRKHHHHQQQHTSSSFRETLREGNHRQLRKTKSAAQNPSQLDFSLIDNLLNEMRAACVFKHPDVLPYIRAIVDRLAHERSIWKRIHGEA